MAVPARSESPLATRTPRAGAANDGYGSLMGMGAPRKKKKPVLVLDADEIAKAHLEMAAGGAQIMEEAADPDYVERPRAPAALLGLAPMGADDAESEDTSAYPPIPDASTWEDEEADILPQIPEDYTDEGELDEEVEDDSPAYNLEHLLRPSAAERDDEDEEDRASVIPSIEEQLKRMRALPTALTDEEVAAEEAASPLRAGPMERLNQMGFGADDLGLSGSRDDDWDDVPDEPASEEPWPAEDLAAEEPLELSEPEIDEEPATAQDEPVPFEDEPFELEMEADPVEEIAPQPEPEPEPLPEMQGHIESVQHFDDVEDGPDLSWMQPEERRELQIASGEHSSLRARLVHADDASAYEPQPSLMERLMRWIAGLFGR